MATMFAYLLMGKKLMYYVYQKCNTFDSIILKHVQNLDKQAAEKRIQWKAWKMIISMVLFPEPFQKYSKKPIAL